MSEKFYLGNCNMKKKKNGDKKKTPYNSKIGYLDESGDNGKNGTKFLVLTYICTDEGKKISKIIKKCKKEIAKTNAGVNWLKKNKGEVKFAKFPNKNLRKKLINDLSKLDIEISCIIIDKSESKIFYEEKKHIIFSVIEDHVENNHDFPFRIVLDNDFLKIKKSNYVFLREYENIDLDKIDISSDVIFSEYKDIDEKNYIRINEENSKMNYCLQAVDLISGSIFREYEFQDKSCTDIINSNNKIKTKFKKIIK